MEPLGVHGDWEEFQSGPALLYVRKSWQSEAERTEIMTRVEALLPSLWKDAPQALALAEDFALQQFPRLHEELSIERTAPLLIIFAISLTTPVSDVVYTINLDPVPTSWEDRERYFPEDIDIIRTPQGQLFLTPLGGLPPMERS